MTTKEYLRQARTLQIGIKGKRERIQQLQELAESVTAPVKDDCVQSGSGEGRMQNVICCIVDFQNEVVEDLERLIELQREMQSKINEVDDREYKSLLELYYLNGLTWESVADRMNYSLRHIYTLHGKALVALESVHVISPS